MDVESLIRDGFCHVPAVLDVTGLAEARAAVGPLLREQREDWGTVSAVDVVPGLCAAAERALAGWFSAASGSGEETLVNKRPREGRRAWHWDWYWLDHPATQRLWPAPFLGVLVYLDDTTPENGATEVVPGSHAFGWLPGDGDRTQPRSDAVVVYARAGDALVFDARVWHASQANHTNANRRAVTVWRWHDRREQASILESRSYAGR